MSVMYNKFNIQCSTQKHYMQCACMGLYIVTSINRQIRQEIKKHVMIHTKAATYSPSVEQSREEKLLALVSSYWLILYYCNMDIDIHYRDYSYS